MSSSPNTKHKPPRQATSAARRSSLGRRALCPALLLLSLALLFASPFLGCRRAARAPVPPAAAPRWVVSTVAGTGARGFADGPAQKAQFKEPHGLALDPSGALFLADTANQRIRKLAAGQVLTVAGSGKQGAGDAPAPTAATFYFPAGLAIDQRWTIYVADVRNNAIRAIDSTGVRTVAGTGEPGYADGPAERALFNEPYDVAVDRAGAVYVADSANNCIRKIFRGQVTTVAGDGHAGFADGPARKARFNQPMGLAVDARGNIYVADSLNFRVRLISRGRVTTIAGSGEQGLRDGPAHESRFAFPTGIAVDAQGNVYVADTANNCVRLIAGGAVTTIAGSGAYGSADGPARQAQFREPWGIAIDSAGNVYVSEVAGHRVRKISPG